MLDSVHRDDAPPETAGQSGRRTVSRPLLEADDKLADGSGTDAFEELWKQAVSEKKIVSCPLTRQIRDPALKQFVQ